MVDLNAITTMDYPFQCPYCDKELDKTNIIDEMKYDVFVIGHNLGGIAVVFECDGCFEKSFIHKDSLKYKS